MKTQKLKTYIKTFCQLRAFTFLFLVIFSVNFIIPNLVLAQEGDNTSANFQAQQQAEQAQKNQSAPQSTGKSYQLLAPLPHFGDTYTTGPGGNFTKYVETILKLSITVAAILAVLMIVIGGFKYMTGESINLKGEGRTQMGNAVLGLLLLAASFLILNTINPALLNFNLTIGNVGNNSSPTTATKPADTPASQLKITEQQRIEAQAIKQGTNMGLDPNKQYQVVESNGYVNQRNKSSVDCQKWVETLAKQGRPATCVIQ